MAPRDHAELAVVLSLAMLACAPSRPSRPPDPPPMTAPSRGAQSDAVGVTATIVVNRCAASSKANARLTEQVMNQLVDGCKSVPGGTAHFSATLEPGGRITLGPIPGTPGTIPLCVVKHELTHHVPLKEPCKLDVKIEETTVSVPSTHR